MCSCRPHSRSAWAKSRLRYWGVLLQRLICAHRARTLSKKGKRCTVEDVTDNKYIMDIALQTGHAKKCGCCFRPEKLILVLHTVTVCKARAGRSDAINQFAFNIRHSGKHWVAPKCTMPCYCNHVLCCPTTPFPFHQRSINVDLPMSVAYPWRWNVF